MSPLILSSSLNPDSRSRVLATAAAAALESAGHSPVFVDLRTLDLPVCDGAGCYAVPDVQKLSGMVAAADGVICATPVYNYDVNAALKNAVELTGKAWTGKVVGFLAAAGGSGSYMSLMGLANSLMLDFRCLIVPRFVYATGADFQGSEVADADVQARVEELATSVAGLSAAWQSPAG